MPVMVSAFCVILAVVADATALAFLSRFVVVAPLNPDRLNAPLVTPTPVPAFALAKLPVVGLVMAKLLPD